MVKKWLVQISYTMRFAGLACDNTLKKIKNFYYGILSLKNEMSLWKQTEFKVIFPILILAMQI